MSRLVFFANTPPPPPPNQDIFGGLMHARVKKLNPHANTPAAVKMNEINPKYENTRNIHRLLTNQNPGLLYKV